MRFFAFATDYDGTLAHDGIVRPPTLEALQRLKAAGRKLLLVTGRELPDLYKTYGHVDIFDRVVAENGALLYNPETKAERPLATPPPERFAELLRERGVSPLSVGRVIVATWDPFQQVVLETLHELGLELQMIFNKGALMILPSGVNKASGLVHALEDLKLSAHNVVGIGDAENDQSFLTACECGVAVSNALPALKKNADWVTVGDHGDGVIELIDQMLADDLAQFSDRLTRYDLLVGEDDQGQPVKLSTAGTTAMVAGTSGGGKSTLTTGVMERLVETRYQFCALDPEGDYQKFNGAVVLGDAKHAPTPDEILAVLDQPTQNAIVNLLGVPLEQRPLFLESLFPRLEELRAHTGRPHWIILDEAHHMLPRPKDAAGFTLPHDLGNMLLITIQPDHVAHDVVAAMDTIIALGEQPGETIRLFCANTPSCPPTVPDGPLPKGKAWLWSRRKQQEPLRLTLAPCHTERTRHGRKYATAELTPDRSFFFTGPQDKLNLRAQNLMIFLQLMDGVDDPTWEFHLHKKEYSEWFRENIKNDELAGEAAKIESDSSLSAEESRRRFREIVEARYTLPA